MQIPRTYRLVEGARSRTKRSTTRTSREKQRPKRRNDSGKDKSKKGNWIYVKTLHILAHGGSHFSVRYRDHHSLSLFITQTGENEPAPDVKPDDDLQDGLGSRVSSDVSKSLYSLSSSFTFLCIFAALINGYLLWKHTEPSVMKGIIGINVVIFGAMLAMIAYFTFLLPIICVGLIFINLLCGVYRS